jgi:hypothetical protein
MAAPEPAREKAGPQIEGAPPGSYPQPADEGDESSPAGAPFGARSGLPSSATRAFAQVGRLLEAGPTRNCVKYRIVVATTVLAATWCCSGPLSASNEVVAAGNAQAASWPV